MSNSIPQLQPGQTEQVTWYTYELILTRNMDGSYAAKSCTTSHAQQASTAQEALTETAILIHHSMGRF